MTLQWTAPSAVTPDTGNKEKMSMVTKVNYYSVGTVMVVVVVVVVQVVVMVA